MLGLAGPSGRAGLGLGVGGGVGVGGPGVLEQHGPCHSGRCCLSLLDLSVLHFRWSHCLQFVQSMEMQQPIFWRQTEQRYWGGPGLGSIPAIKRSSLRSEAGSTLSFVWLIKNTMQVEGHLCQG